MVRLNEKDYPLVLPHLEKVNFNYMFAKSVLDLEVEGQVYTDSLSDPKNFYILHSYGMSLLFGDENNDGFNNWLCRYLLNANNQRKQVEWLQVYPTNWNNKLDLILGDNLLKKREIYDFIDGASTSKKVIENTRVNFKFDKDRYHLFRKDIDLNSFIIVRTNKDLYNEMNGSVVPKSFWKSGELFEKQGIGFSLLFDGKLASTAYSAFVHGNQLEIGIETIPEFQGKGFAAIICCSIIDYCLSADMEPVWSCRLENVASFKLAQKLGFEPVAYRPYYEVRL